MPRLENGHWQFRLTGLPNTSYLFQASTNLTTWMTLTNLASPTGLIDFTDAEATNHPSRFYRVLEQ